VPVHYSLSRLMVPVCYSLSRLMVPVCYSLSRLMVPVRYSLSRLTGVRTIDLTTLAVHAVHDWYIQS